MIAPAHSFPPAAMGLLARARAGAPAQAEPAAASADYDWDSPCRFDPGQLRRLRDLASAAADELARRLGQLLQMPVAIRPGPFAQHYGRSEQLQPASTKDDKSSDVRVAIRVGEGVAASRAGWLNLDASFAAAWIARLLGGAPTEAPAQARPLSALETTLLQDVLAAICESLAGALHKPVAAGQAPAEQIETDAEYASFQFLAGDKPLLAVILTASAAEELCSAQARQGKPADPRPAMLAHLEQTTAEATACTVESRVAVADLMALETGDVLLLDFGPQSPLRLMVDGQEVLSGEPVICDGHYAVRVAAPSGAAPAPSKNPIRARAAQG
jgi:flagellar motor switch protein FliM